MSRTIFSSPFLSCPPSTAEETEELGPVRYNNDGKAVGREIVSTPLAGTWAGNANSLLINPPATPGDKCSGRTIIEAGNGQQWFFMQPNGVFKAYADGCRDGVRLIRGAVFEGRMFYMTPYHYAVVLGAHNPDVSTWSGSYYPAMLNRDRTSCTIFLLGVADGAFTNECRDYGVLFKEQQWYNKISDTVDLELMREVRSYSDQWLWQAAPEENAAGQQYPPECPAPAPDYPVEGINTCWGDLVPPDLLP
jgi:hypothetical protein